MPLGRSFKWFAVEDAKIAPILTDPEGGTTTYGTLYDVPGIKTVGLSGDITSVDLRGDNTLLDSASVLSGLTVAFDQAKLSLDVLSAILGYTVTDAGTTPSQTVTADLTSASALIKPFYLEAKTPSGGTFVGGDGHMVFWKCVLSKFPEMGFAEENYRTVSSEAKVVPLASNGRWHRIRANETATAISAVAT